MIDGEILTVLLLTLRVAATATLLIAVPATFLGYALARWEWRLPFRLGWDSLQPHLYLLLLQPPLSRPQPPCHPPPWRFAFQGKRLSAAHLPPRVSLPHKR